MSEEMGTTTTVPTDGASRLAHTEQVQPTPGPWYASRKHSFVMTKNYVVIAEIRGRPEQKANALLIAAAPDMLAAIKAARPYIEHAVSDDLCSGSTPAHETLRQLIAAIAKAEGRAP